MGRQAENVQTHIFSTDKIIIGTTYMTAELILKKAMKIQTDRCYCNKAQFVKLSCRTNHLHPFQKHP